MSGGPGGWQPAYHAVGSLLSRTRDHDANNERSHRRITRRRATRSRKDFAVPLIPAPPAVPDRDPVPLRLERELHAQLRDYAEFLGSTKEYIVSEALRRVFRHDKDFLAWQRARQQASQRSTATAPAPPAAQTDPSPDTTRPATPEATRRSAGKDRP